MTISLVRLRETLDPRWILRVASFVCILFGALSILATAFPQAKLETYILVSGVSLEEAFGFTFLGFAIRLARLENYRVPVRMVVRTSRFCLLAVGSFGLVGISLLRQPGAVDGNGTPVASSFPASLCFLALGGVLFFNESRENPRTAWAPLALACTQVACCWIAIFLSAAGLASIPWFLSIGFPSVLLLTLVCAGLTRFHLMPEFGGPHLVAGAAAATARQTLPVAIALPILLAVLRNRAEISGYLQPQLGLLLHVLLSAGAMAFLVGWSTIRLAMADRLRESVEAAFKAKEEQQRQIFRVLAEPVWIFDGGGGVQYSNAAAHRFSRADPGDEPVNIADIVGAVQLQAMLGSAFFGHPLAVISLKARTGPDGPTNAQELDSAASSGSVVRASSLKDTETGSPRNYAVAFLSQQPSYQDHSPGLRVILVAGTTPLPDQAEEAASILAMSRALEGYPLTTMIPEPAPPSLTIIDSFRRAGAAP